MPRCIGSSYGTLVTDIPGYFFLSVIPIHSRNLPGRDIHFVVREAQKEPNFLDVIKVSLPPYSFRFFLPTPTQLTTISQLELARNSIVKIIRHYGQRQDSLAAESGRTSQPR